ncbi:MAG TPA: hypothetical protein VFY26_11795 [Anaerolineales bacterium]|nr:hypothetical protein [Anaerolineales bacterium]
MLNLLVRLMKTFSFFLSFLFFLLAAQDSPPVAISSPVAGEALRGQVNIIGSTSVPDFISAQLDFAYASDPIGTWFPLQTLPQSVFDSPLFTWDTTLITDGDYILRLRVFAGDGSFQEVTVPVSIQNDAIPTAIPAATATPEEGTVLVPTPFLLAASQTPTDVPRPTPTPLPTNPVSLDSTTILLSLGRGALVLLGMFALAGLILRIRRF